MKRLFTLLLIFSIATVQLGAQIIFSESFDNGIPTTFKIHKVDDNTYDPMTGLDATFGGWFDGGGAAVSCSWFSPVGTADRWMVTPSITVPALSNPNNKLKLVFYQRSSDPAPFSDSYEVRIGTVDQEITNLSKVLLSVTKAQTKTTWTINNIDLTTYAGQNIFLAWRNTSNDGTFLYIDEINLIEAQPVQVIARDIPNVIYNPVGDLNIGINFTNFGYNNLTSLTTNYQIDNDPVNSSNTSTSLNVPFLSDGTDFSSVKFNATKGVHTLKVWPSNPNGNGSPAAIGDTLEIPLVIYDQTDHITRTSIAEMFSSSTCPPCKAGWEAYEATIGILPNKPIQMKVQQPFPGFGDPYTTDEAYNRAAYYNVAGIPDLIIDGNGYNNHPANCMPTHITAAAARPAIAKFDLKYSLDTNAHSIHIYGTYTPQVDMVESTRLQVGIFEKKTTKNVATNGEVEFINVLKKYMIDENGLDLKGAKEDAQQTLDFTYTFKGKYRLPLNGTSANIIDHAIEHSVEEFTDLAAHAWIECGRDRYILNATTAQFTSGTEHIPAITSIQVYPNPVNDVATVALDMNEELNGQLYLVDLAGHQVWNSGKQTYPVGQTKVTIPVDQLSNGLYNVVFRSGTKIASTELIVRR